MTIATADSYASIAARGQSLTASPEEITSGVAMLDAAVLDAFGSAS